MVNPDISTVPLIATPSPISKTRLFRLPLTEITFAPGPLIVRLVGIASSPLVSATVPFSPG